MFPGRIHFFLQQILHDNCTRNLFQGTAVIPTLSRIGDNVPFFKPFQAYLPVVQNKNMQRIRRLAMELRIAEPGTEKSFIPVI